MVCFPFEAADERRNRLVLLPQKDGPAVLQRRPFLTSVIQSSGDTDSLVRLEKLVTDSRDEVIVHHVRQPGHEAQTQSLRQWSDRYQAREPSLHLIETGVDLAELASLEANLLAMCMDTALVVRSFRVQRPELIDRIILDPAAATLDEVAAERLSTLFEAVVHPFPAPRLVLLADRIAAESE